jgi:hypothetical protein
MRCFPTIARGNVGETPTEPAGAPCEPGPRGRVPSSLGSARAPGFCGTALGAIRDFPRSQGQ